MTFRRKLNLRMQDVLLGLLLGNIMFSATKEIHSSTD